MIRATVLLVLLLLATPAAAHAAGLGRSCVPAAETPSCPRVVVGQYAWDPRAQLRDWADWRVRLSAPVWVPGITGSFASGSGEIEGPQGGDEGIVEAEGALSFAMVGRVELRRGRWGLNADGFAATITQNVGFRRTGFKRLAEGDITGILVRGDVNFLLGEWWPGVRGRPTRLQLRAYAGVRSYNVHVVLSRVFGLDVKQDVRAEWIDPIVGIRAAWDVSRRFSLRAEADVGGFDVGSEFAAWASVFAEWRFSRVVSLALGYSWLDFEHSFSFAGEGYRWKATLQGPTLALGVKF